MSQGEGLQCLHLAADGGVQAGDEAAKEHGGLQSDDAISYGFELVKVSRYRPLLCEFEEDPGGVLVR